MFNGYYYSNCLENFIAINNARITFKKIPKNISNFLSDISILFYNYIYTVMLTMNCGFTMNMLGKTRGSIVLNPRIRVSVNIVNMTGRDSTVGACSTNQQLLVCNA